MCAHKLTIHKLGVVMSIQYNRNRKVTKQLYTESCSQVVYSQNLLTYSCRLVSSKHTLQQLSKQSTSESANQNVLVVQVVPAQEAKLQQGSA